MRSRNLFFLKKKKDKKFSKKKININNSKVFFKDDEDNTVAIIKMPQALFFYDNLKLNNIFRVKGEIFKAPFILNLLKNFDSKKIETLISSDKLKLKISNEYSNLTDKIAEGLMSISVLNFKTQTKYEIEENLIFFESDQTTVKNPNFNYKGRLFTKPFKTSPSRRSNISLILGSKEKLSALERGSLPGLFNSF